MLRQLVKKIISFERIVEKLFVFYRKITGNLPTYEIHNFRRNAHLISPKPDQKEASRREFGIVIQGPIKHENMFTFKTIEMYLRDYPGCVIVLSTWNDENTASFRELAEKNTNFLLILNEKPVNEGISHINYQILSSFAGVSRLRELQVKYSLKTRTDQCFFNPLTFEILREKLGSDSSKKKIIFLSLGTFLFRPYAPSDFFQFGLTESIEKYWSIPFDDREKKDQPEINGWTSREFSKFAVCEVYPAIEYLKSNGEYLDYTLENSLLMFKKYFLIIDAKRLDFVWDKYTYRSDRNKQNELPSPFQEFNESLELVIGDQISEYSKLDYLLDLPVKNRKFEV